LVACASPRPTKGLWLTPPRVSYEESPVVGDEGLLELDGRGGILVLADVGNDGLGKCLADSVDLRGVATASDADTDVNLGEWVLAAAGSAGEGLLEEEDGFVDLVAESLGLDKVDRSSVDADETLALLNNQSQQPSTSFSLLFLLSPSTYLCQGNSCGSLLLAKSLDALFS
jgi:hypothetical protein